MKRAVRVYVKYQLKTEWRLTNQYLFDVVHYSTQRFRITYEERVPDKMQRTKRYDYSPPGPSPLRKTHIHRRGRGGKGNGMARRARYLAKQARREARREAEHVAQPPPETQITPLPDLMDTMTVQKDETKAVEKAVLLRKTRKHVRSAAARVKRNSKSRFRARRARLLKSEELLSNGP